RLESAFQRLGIRLYPLRIAARFRGLCRPLDAQLRLRSLGHLDDIARTALVRRDVHPLAVDEDAVVAHHLPGFRARRAETHAVGHAVQPPLEDLPQHLAGHALAAGRVLVWPADLSFKRAVDAALLLLLAERHAVTRLPCILLAVLSRRIIAALNCAFVGETFLPLHQEFFAFAAALP